MAEEKKEMQGLKDEKEQLIKKLDDSGYDFNKHPHVKGIIKDNQRERELRHSAENEIAQLRKENQILKQEMTQQDEPEDVPDLLGKDIKDDDYLTVAQARKLLQKTQEQQQKMTQSEKKKEQARRVMESEEKAMDKYTASKVGEGLDYKSVIADGYKDLVKKNPALHKAVQQSPNPAEEAYRIGLTHPQVREKMLAIEKQKLLQSMKTNKTPKSGGGSSIGEDPEMDSLLSKSTEELEAELQELEEG